MIIKTMQEFEEHRAIIGKNRCYYVGKENLQVGINDVEHPDIPWARFFRDFSLRVIIPETVTIRAAHAGDVTAITWFPGTCRVSSTSGECIVLPIDHVDTLDGYFEFVTQQLAGKPAWSEWIRQQAAIEVAIEEADGSSFDLRSGT